MRYCRFSKPVAHHSSLSFHIIVVFSINLRTKCVFLVMLRPPLPPCTHLYALVLTPPPPLGAYVINGRPLTIRRCEKGFSISYLKRNLIKIRNPGNPSYSLSIMITVVAAHPIHYPTHARYTSPAPPHPLC